MQQLVRRSLLSLLGVALLGVGIQQLVANIEDDGKVLAMQYCQSCHRMPLPEHLDKTTWLTKVFPMMREYMGLDQKGNRELLPHDLQAMFPTTATMTEDEWFAVANWYIDNAPDSLPTTVYPTSAGVSPVFRATIVPTDVTMPMTTLVRFDTASGRVITGDAMLGTLRVHDVSGALLQTIDIGGPVSSLDMRGGSWYVTNMGKLLPHDSAAGSVVLIEWNGSQYTRSTIIDSLRRPTHLRLRDVNGDGRDDLVICEYGNLLGRLGWFERRGSRWVYHELLNQPGAIRTEVRDINADGRMDIIALMAQAREGVFAFLNRGKGRFEMTEVVTFPPSYGTSSFSFADVDRDGTEELIVTTGDNGDYVMPPFKPYHGVYVFSLDARGRATQISVQQLDGAYGAIARDFTLDGSVDMVAFSYFPRLDRGDLDVLRFQTSAFHSSTKTWSIPMSDRGRWLVSDCADVDHDGDLDLLLGNVSIGPGRITDQESAGWMNGKVAALLLVNTTRP